jgi:cathepsin L
MKVFIIIAALVAVACAEVSLHQVFQAKWNNFKATHGKSYHREHEPKALQAFLENTHAVETHNEKFAKGHVSFQLGHNEFADMPHDEFVNKMMGFRAPPPQASQNATVFAYNPELVTPTGCDWRGYSSMVKNQGQCGSCYSFAANAALECAIQRKTGRQVFLSEQNHVDCSGRHGNYGCNGGFMTACFKYIKDNGGIHHEAHYPYEGVVKTCRYNPNGKPTERLTGHVEIPYGNENALNQALHTSGSIAIALDASPRTFMLYTKGIYNEPSCNPQKLSHAVTLCGSGVENGVEYYMVKNSWGTGWGEGGYIRMIKGKNMCGIANMASYPVV